MLPHTNFPYIAQHHIFCPTCAPAATIFWHATGFAYVGKGHFQPQLLVLLLFPTRVELLLKDTSEIKDTPSLRLSPNFIQIIISFILSLKWGHFTNYFGPKGVCISHNIWHAVIQPGSVYYILHFLEGNYLQRGSHIAVQKPHHVMGTMVTWMNLAFLEFPL